MRIKLSLSMAVLLSAAACSDAPTTVAPPEARFDGGWTIGSGGDADSTTVAPATTAGESVCPLEKAGGWTIGSGGGANPDPDQCEVH